LGHALCLAARQQWSVYGVFNRHRPVIDGIQPMQADLTVTGTLAELVRSVRPRAIVHAAAMADVGYCQQHPGTSAVINTQVPAALAKLCKQEGISFVHTSTDLVFDGKQAPYKETDPTVPLGVYARQKVRAEQAVLQAYPGALVCRLPLMVGLMHCPTYHFCYRMLHAIAHGKELDLFFDEYRTPVDTDSAAAGILLVMGKSSGLLHLGGRTRLSRYELGVLMAEAMEVKPAMVRPISVTAVRSGAARAPDVSLDSRLAYSLGYDPMALSDYLRRLARRFQIIENSDGIDTLPGRFYTTGENT
jgi:dTDP-4-dehydrorhamnose reductase